LRGIRRFAVGDAGFVPTRLRSSPLRLLVCERAFGTGRAEAKPFHLTADSANQALVNGWTAFAVKSLVALAELGAVCLEGPLRAVWACR
jgi:hypothetical protein